MKSFIKYFILMLAIVPMASCVKLGSGNSNKDYSSGKLVKSIIGREDDYLFTIEFSYDEQGRVIKSKFDDSRYSEETQFVYNNDQMQVICESDYYETCYFDNGNLVKVSFEGSSNLFTYTQGSSKPKSMFFDNKGGHHYYSYTDNYIWDSKGNLVQRNGVDIPYFDIENKCNIDVYPLIFPYLSEAVFFIDRNAFHSITSTNLPSKIYDNEISYSFDSDGYPTEMRFSYRGEVWKVFTILY